MDMNKTVQQMFGDLMWQIAQANALIEAQAKEIAEMKAEKENGKVPVVEIIKKA